MKRFDLKQFIICLLAVVSSRFAIAGVCPLVPAIFMAGYMSGVNRSLLFLCTLGGLLVLAPVHVLVKYGVAVILSAVLVKAAEWYFRNCRTFPAALITGCVTAGVTIAWELLGIFDTATVPIGILEGVFVCAFVYVAARISCLFIEWEPPAREEDRFSPRNGQRLSEYAESFARLSKTFSGMNRYKNDFTAEELSRMQSEVTGRVCVSCSQCALCWEQEDTSMYQVLYRFLQSLHSGKAMDESAMELKQHCPHTEELAAQVQLIFEKARLNLAWYNRLQENRDVIAQQLDAMAYIMEDCAREEQDVTIREGRLAAAVRYAFREKGAVVSDLRILERPGGKSEVLFRGHTRGKKCISVREMAKIISSIADRPFVPSRESSALLGEKAAELLFCEESRLAAGYGVARAVRDDEQVSGDSFSFQLLDGGTCVMSVSDGMGSGYAACKESEMVIDLIEKFMEAGFEPETALRMMNSAMVTHGDNNLFSTVDLMRLDLDSGEGEFYKIGAADTYIRHGDEVRAVSCGGMPAGIFADLQISRIGSTIEDGDIVVMMTDGVSDHLHVPDAMEEMKEIILGVETGNPARFARQVLEQVLSRTGGKVRDDMTVLAACVWEK